MEKKNLVTGRGIETADMTSKRKNIPDEFKHLSRAAKEPTKIESYRKWRTERIKELKRKAEYGTELAELLREEAQERG